MYCSDCHGSASPYIEGDTSTHKVDPAPGAAWGPHGSDEGFILKGRWDVNTSISLGTQLCFRCHKRSEYGGGNNESSTTGFSTGSTNLHDWHAGQLGGLRCTWCHVAVPHGWRNKALLVDISTDPEAVSCGGSSGVNGCTAPPYYMNAYLGGAGPVNWRVSGEWASKDCNTPGTNFGCFGWMGGMMGGGGTSCASPN